jgi:hypothetical protein
MLFRAALADVLLEPAGTRRWYLSAVNLLAARGEVHVVAVDGAGSAEIDYPHDLPRAQALVTSLAEQLAIVAPRPWVGSDVGSPLPEERGVATGVSRQ